MDRYECADVLRQLADLLESREAKDIKYCELEMTKTTDVIPASVMVDSKGILYTGVYKFSVKNYEPK